MTPLLRTAPAVALGLLALGGLPGCGRPDAGEGPRAAEGGVQQRELPSVRVARVERRAMLRVLETTSKLESEREIQLFPRVPGVVTEILVEEGDRVQKGDLLAQLDDRDEALALKDAETALAERKNELALSELAVQDALTRQESAKRASEQAERDHERDLQLSESKDVASPLSKQAIETSRLQRDQRRTEAAQAEIAGHRAELEVDAASNAVSRAEVALDRARLAFDYRRIEAPFDALVAERSIRVGDTVGTGEPAFVLTDLELLRVVFSRPQEELELFARVGAVNGEGRLAIQASADSYPGRVFPGWVERVSPTIEAQSGQFRVTGRLECSQDGGRVRLLPGMLVRLRIVTDRHEDALVVPKRALEREGERRYVLAVDPDPEAGTRGTVRRVEILEGFAEDEFIEVVPHGSAKLAPLDAVIVVGGRDLGEGDAVEVDEERAASDPAPDPEPPSTAEGEAGGD